MRLIIMKNGIDNDKFMITLVILVCTVTFYSLRF